MKKYFWFLLIPALYFISCTTTKLSKTGDQEKQFVATFLTYMDYKMGPKRSEMMSCISPAYIKKNGISKEKYKVNNYAVWGFNIESYNRDQGLVVAKIWGEDKKWQHRLTFKVVKENGKLYLMPSKHSDNYIDPWYSVQNYVKD